MASCLVLQDVKSIFVSNGAFNTPMCGHLSPVPGHQPPFPKKYHHGHTAQTNGLGLRVRIRSRVTVKVGEHLSWADV